MACAVRSLSISTGAAGTTQTVNDLDFDPDFLMICVSGRSDATDTAGNGNIMFSFGVASSGGTRRVVATQGAHNVATSECDSAADDDCVVQAISTAGASSGKLDVDAWVSNGVRFIVDAQFSVAYRAHILFVSGVTTSVTTWTTPGAVGSSDITGLGGDLEAVLFMGIALNDTFPTIGGRGGVCIGAAANLGGSIVNAIMQTHFVDGDPNNSASGICKLDHCFVACNASGNVNEAGLVTARVADGVTVNSTNAFEGRDFYVVGLKGLDIRIIELATRTDTSTTFGSGALTFTPRGGTFMGRGQNENPDINATEDGDGSIGFWDEDGAAVAQAWMYNTNSDPSVLGTAVDHDDLYVNLDDDGSTVEGRATFSASDSDSVDFIMSDADPASYFAWGLVFGGDAAGGGAPATAIKDIIGCGVVPFPR